MPRPKSANKAQKNLAKARRILAGAVARDDSDDELGLEDHPWQYVYAQDGSDVIVGAWMGKFRCGVGDIVLLKAEGSKEAWVGLICEFGDIVFGAEDEGEGEKREMAANFMWFATEKEVNPRNKQKKRMDSLPVLGSAGIGWICANWVTARALHHTSMGLESSYDDQWHRFDSLRQVICGELPIIQNTTIVQGVWKDLPLPTGLQYPKCKLHRGVRLGEVVRRCGRYP